MQMSRYILSEIADADLDEIYEYTKKEFGADQAVKYLLEVEEVFQQYFINPEMGRKRDEIKKGLYSFPKHNHIIFYRIFEDHICIVRVLHGSKDIPSHF